MKRPFTGCSNIEEQTVSSQDLPVHMWLTSHLLSTSRRPLPIIFPLRSCCALPPTPPPHTCNLHGETSGTYMESWNMKLLRSSTFLFLSFSSSKQQLTSSDFDTQRKLESGSQIWKTIEQSNSIYYWLVYFQGQCKKNKCEIKLEKRKSRLQEFMPVSM